MSLVTRLKNFQKRQTVEHRYKKLKRQNLNHAAPEEFNWNWKEIHYNRIALLNLMMGSVGGTKARYLEIGCNDNSLFDSVYSTDKTGVDPTLGGTHRLTSDEFFAQNDRKFDLIFVDGLHHYDQIRRDTVNAIQALAPGGWILFHDFLPRNWGEHHVPRIQDTWTGDGWKVAWELTQTAGADFRIFHIDHGVGALRLNGATPELSDLSEELADAQFSYFVDIIDKLPVVDWHKGLDWIESGTVAS